MKQKSVKQGECTGEKKEEKREKDGIKWKKQRENICCDICYDISSSMKHTVKYSI